MILTNILGALNPNKKKVDIGEEIYMKIPVPVNIARVGLIKYIRNNFLNFENNFEEYLVEQNRFVRLKGFWGTYKVTHNDYGSWNGLTNLSLVRENTPFRYIPKIAKINSFRMLNISE